MAGATMNPLILQATEELLLGSIGSVRVIEAGQLLRDAFTGMPDLQLADAAVVAPRFEVEPVEQGRTGAVGPETASVHVIGVTAKIRFAMSLPSQVQASADARRDARMAVVTYLEEIRKALTWPGNVAMTQSGQATGVVSGCWARVGPWKVERENHVAKVIKAEALGRAFVKVAAQTS